MGPTLCTGFHLAFPFSRPRGVLQEVRGWKLSGLLGTSARLVMSGNAAWSGGEAPPKLCLPSSYVRRAGSTLQVEANAPFFLAG